MRCTGQAGELGTIIIRVGEGGLSYLDLLLLLLCPVGAVLGTLEKQGTDHDKAKTASSVGLRSRFSLHTNNNFMCCQQADNHRYFFPPSVVGQILAIPFSRKALWTSDLP